MTNTEFKALRGAFEGLTAIEEQLSRMTFGDEGVIEAVHQLVSLTEKATPGVLPTFNQLSYDPIFGANQIKLKGLHAYVAAAISVLSVALEDEGAVIPRDLLEFDYVQSPPLRAILQRDYRELLRALNAKCWKACVVLSGGLIEAVLLDQILQEPKIALAAKSAPGKNADIPTWRFVDLIKVAIELRIVGKGADKLSHSVREYRNLVHAHAELRENLTAEEPEANIAFGIAR